MFIKQILIPVLIIAATCFWGGMRFEQARWQAKENQKKQSAVKTIRKGFNWKV